MQNHYDVRPFYAMYCLYVQRMFLGIFLKIRENSVNGRNSIDSCPGNGRVVSCKTFFSPLQNPFVLWEHDYSW